MNSEDIKLSFVIPVYNCEKIIGKCLKSILQQAEKAECQYEIVLVDDGSSDNSVKAIQSLIQGRDNCLLCQQKNAGAGVARNTALQYVTGDYLIFIDADDYVPDQYFDVVLSELKKILK